MKLSIPIRPDKLSGIQMVAILMAATVVGLFGFWWRTHAQVAGLERQVESLGTQAGQLNADITALSRLKSSLPNAAKIRVPASLNVAQVLTDGQKLATSQHVKVVSLLVNPAQDPPPSSGVVSAFQGLGLASTLHAYPIDVTVVGSRADVLRYVQRLTAGHDFATISSVQFSVPAPGRMQAVIAYEIYTQAN